MNMMAKMFFLFCKDKMIPELLADGYLIHFVCFVYQAIEISMVNK